MPEILYRILIRLSIWP